MRQHPQSNNNNKEEKRKTKTKLQHVTATTKQQHETITTQIRGEEEKQHQHERQQQHETTTRAKFNICPHHVKRNAKHITHGSEHTPQKPKKMLNFGDTSQEELPQRRNPSKSNPQKHFLSACVPLKKKTLFNKSTKNNNTPHAHGFLFSLFFFCGCTLCC